MPYKTELHCHSATVSRCGHITPEHLVARYLEAGYTTVVLTEHFSARHFNADSRYRGAPDDWNAKIDFYLSGYETLRRAAADAEQKTGKRLHILLGIEADTETAIKTHFLAYGVTEPILRGLEGLFSEPIDTFFERLHAAGLRIYQAHPFRDKVVVTNPKYLDGIEVYNSNERHCSRNDVALYWAQRFGLPGISGSDLHRPTDGIGGGILTDDPIPDNETLLRVLSSGRYTLIREGHPMEDPPRET